MIVGCVNVHFLVILTERIKAPFLVCRIISASILLSKAWFGLKLGGSGSRN